MATIVLKRSLPDQHEVTCNKRSKNGNALDLTPASEPLLFGEKLFDSTQLSLADSQQARYSVPDDGPSCAATTPSSTPGLRTKKREKKFLCDFPGCGKAYTRPVRLAEHQRSHTNDRPFHCGRDGCDKSFLRDSHLKAHIKSHHEDTRDWVCDFPGCGKGFATGQRMREHRRRHDKREQGKCSTCGQYFRLEETLERHVIEAHATDVGFRCEHVVNDATGEVCGQWFEKSRGLRQHTLRMHSGFKHFCQQCPTAREGSEMYVDDTSSQLPNLVGFATHAELLQHMRDQHPPTCEVCGERCSTSGKLKAHMDIEHQSVDARRTVPCQDPACDRKFTRKGNMLVHFRSAHENQKYVCEGQSKYELNHVPGWTGAGACGEGFVTKATLENHIRTQHLNLPVRGAGKEKRKARKARMAAQSDGATRHGGGLDASLSRPEESFVGAACILETCTYLAADHVELVDHLVPDHGKSPGDASTAVDLLRRHETLADDRFWIGGEVDEGLEALELAAQLEQVLGVQSPPDTSGW